MFCGKRKNYASLENRYLYVTDARKANTPAFLGGQGVVGGKSYYTNLMLHGDLSIRYT